MQNSQASQELPHNIGRESDTTSRASLNRWYKSIPMLTTISKLHYRLSVIDCLPFIPQSHFWERENSEISMIPHFRAAEVKEPH